MVSMSNEKQCIVLFPVFRVLYDSECHNKARIVGETYVATANAEARAYATASFRPDDHRPPTVVVQDANVAQPDTVGKSGTHRLDRSLFSGKPHCQEAHGIIAARVEFQFLVHQYS